MADVTQILRQIDEGDSSAAEKLLPLVYDELRKLAKHKMSQEKSGQTLQATALVHEAYLRLAGENRKEGWRSRRQFFAAASEAMRRILVETARRKMTLKQGGNIDRQQVELSQLESSRPPEEVVALSDALELLYEKDATKAELVKLRYFLGMTVAEAAEVLGISTSSVDREWAYVRAWLHQQIAESDAL